MQIIIKIIDMTRTQIQFSFFLVVCLGKILKTSLETVNEQPSPDNYFVCKYLLTYKYLDLHVSTC